MVKSGYSEDGRVAISRPPVKPPGMSTEAEKIWDTVMANMPRGSITVVDQETLSSYCEISAEILWMQPMIKAEPYFVSDRGCKTANPMISLTNKNRQMQLQYARALGLTPSARGLIKVSTVTEQKSKFSTKPRKISSDQLTMLDELGNDEENP